jgi:hypothetical protein
MLVLLFAVATIFIAAGIWFKGDTHTRVGAATLGFLLAIIAVVATHFDKQ